MDLTMHADSAVAAALVFLLVFLLTVWTILMVGLLTGRYRP